MVNAGYEIIDQKPVEPGYEIVLGHHPSERCPQPWVTWIHKLGTDDFFWGHYFCDESDARKDLNERR